MKEEIIVTTPSILKSLIEESVRKIMQEKSISSSSDESKPKFLTAKEAAKFLNISLSTLHRYTCKRIIPFFKQGKILYFKLKELEQWLEKGRKKTTAQLKTEIEEKGTLDI